MKYLEIRKKNSNFQSADYSLFIKYSIANFAPFHMGHAVQYMMISFFYKLIQYSF